MKKILTKREEEVFLPNQSDSILLPRDSNALYLIQRIRDEAHRFAITFHRDLRSKKLKNGKSKTNVDSIIWQEVLITKTIDNFEKGEAKAKNGVIWTAISNDSIILKKGTVCSVVSIEGNTICVEEKNEVN